MLLVKVAPPKPGRVVTFFMKRAQGEGADTFVDFVPDDSARAPATRKLPAAALACGATLRAVGESGADLAPPAVFDGSAGTITWESAGLTWRLACDFSRDGDALTAEVARLTVEEAPEFDI